MIERVRERIYLNRKWVVEEASLEWVGEREKEREIALVSGA